MSKSGIAQKCSGGNTKPLSKFRTYCFTLFTDVKPSLNNDQFKHIVAGREQCPKTNKIHYQCCVYFHNQKTITAAIKHLQSHFNVKCHVELCKGTYEENIAYCTKDNDYEELGVRPSQGKRSDIIQIKDDIMSGKITTKDVILDNPIFYHQYGRTLDKIEDFKKRLDFRKEMTTGVWYYGKTGVGKSHLAFKDFNPKTHYVLPNDNGWWDGYEQQETVIINEFRGELTFKTLLELCDKWPYSVKRRGREPMPFTSKKVIITSCHPPEGIYKNLEDGDKMDQLLRRFQIIKL